MKKLIEVEMDGQSVAQQVRELSDVLVRVREEPRMATTSVKKLRNQKERLLEKLANFEATNQSLRMLLREQHQEEGMVLHIVEQKEALLQKLSDSERVNEVGTHTRFQYFWQTLCYYQIPGLLERVEVDIL